MEAINKIVEEKQKEQDNEKHQNKMLECTIKSR